MTQTNGAGVPFQGCHCFDTITRVCHYCKTTLREFITSGCYDNKDNWCKQIMQPVEGHQKYLEDRFRASI